MPRIHRPNAVTNRSRRPQTPTPSAPVPTGSAPVPTGSASVPTAPPSKVPEISEKQEEEALEKNDGKATLTSVFKGTPGKGHRITVHGINAAPETMDPIHEDAASRGESVHTLNFDDQGARLGETSDQLADAIEKHQEKYPNEPLSIDGHSMGGRIAVDALRKLAEQDKLKGSVKLNLINPVLGGTKSGNWADMAFGPLNKIPGVTPGKDMGTKSDFQETLEGTQLPPNVVTSIKVGSEDTIVNKDDPHFKAVADGLNATVQEIPGANHDDLIAKSVGR
jgi:hypothetical protein